MSSSISLLLTGLIRMKCTYTESWDRTQDIKLSLLSSGPRF